jgi:hypothetical protein
MAKKLTFFTKSENWKTIARHRATNPEYPALLMKSIKDELDHKKQPDRAYIKSKIRALDNFIDNDGNFLPDRKIYSEIKNMKKVV